MKEQCDAWMMQMRSLARAFTLSGTVQLEDIEWHEGRHELFDQLLDDCACECERMDAGGSPLMVELGLSPVCRKGGYH
eukprot:2803040-Amphidinium_carterae.1